MSVATFAMELTTWRLQKVTFLFLLAAVIFLALRPAMRGWLVRRPVKVVCGLVFIDAVFYLWGTLPFVPTGVDESQFAINALVLRGADLPIGWIRTPLPVCGAALSPWHPPLPGIGCRGLAIVAVFLVVRRSFGSAFGLLGAYWTMAAGHLGKHSAALLSEPYGAACVAGFMWLLSSRRWCLATIVAGLGFASRWQLGVLLLPALFYGFRLRGIFGASFGLALFMLPVALLAPLTGADPWRAFTQESQREFSILDRVAEYAEPMNGFGLGLGFVLVAIGLWSLRYRHCRHEVVLLAAAVFAIYAAAILGIGVITTRFFAPVVPAGVVLMVAGTSYLAQSFAHLKRPLLGGLLLALVSVALAMPAQVPKTRYQKAQSVASALRADRSVVIARVGDAPVYTDYNVLSTTALLGRRCHAVLWAMSRHPDGLSLSFDGEIPAVIRADVPSGAFYLTFDPSGRPMLWQGRGLALVRW